MFVFPKSNESLIESLPAEVLLHILEKTGPDPKLRSVCKQWMTLIDAEAFKNLYRSYEKSPILTRVVQQPSTDGNWYHKIKTIYHTVKIHRESLNSSINALAKVTLSLKDLGKIEKPYQQMVWASNLLILFQEIARHIPQAHNFFTQLSDQNMNEVKKFGEIKLSCLEYHGSIMHVGHDRTNTINS